VTLPPEILTVTLVTRDDQLSVRRHGTVYCLIFGFAVCWIPFPWGELDVKGVLKTSCVVVAAREPWMLPILVV
jgi:hypothetical protein